MEDKDKLDRFLDQALSEYSEASPRPGFEQRILANLAAQEEERGFGWRWLWVAGPVFSAVVVLAVVFVLRTAQKHDSSVAVVKPPIEQPAKPPRQVAPKQLAVAQVLPKRKIQREVIARAQPAPEPRLATFPAQDGDEQQARLLLSFVTRHPERAKEVVNQEQEFQEMAEANFNQDSNNRSERQR